LPYGLTKRNRMLVQFGPSAESYKWTFVYL